MARKVDVDAAVKKTLNVAKVDGRTMRAKRLRQAKKMLAADFDAASEAVLRNDLAINLSIQSELTDLLFKNGVFCDGGKYADIITGHIAKFQSSNRQIIKLLSAFQDKKALKEKKNGDVPSSSQMDPGSLILNVISCDDESDD